MKRSRAFKRNRSPILTFLLLSYLILGKGPVPGISEDSEPPKPFPEVEGWKISSDIEIYTPEDLYNYINGASELYLSYDFQELRVAEYFNDSKASIIIEIYRHKTPVHAFGIYSQERPLKGNFLNIGAQGYSEETILNFVTGNWYVKINGYDVDASSQEVLRTFARKVAENLRSKASLPIILTCFPNKWKKQNSEKFIARNFLGYAFLHSAFTANYEYPRGTFKLFIIEGTDKKDCEKMLRQYLQHTGLSKENVKEGRYILADPYHGKIALFWRGKYIWGVLNLPEANLRSKYLKLIEEELRRITLIE